MNDAEQVFAFLAAEPGPAALVTVTGVTGSSTRNPGAHMAVAADGRFAGSLSGGCIEAAVVAEAQLAIAEDQARAVRFGAGSPFIDIRLPCGGGIDLLITPLPERALAAEAMARFGERRPFVIRLSQTGAATIRDGQPGWRTRVAGDDFEVAHLPALRIVVAGHGAAVDHLQAQARAFGVGTRVITPDRALAERMAAAGAAVSLIEAAERPVAIDADRWTAVAFLFHDHDWEPRLIREALASPAFYVGAMGSRATHAARVALLAAAGFDHAAIGRIRSPIGLIPSSREPQTLAVSALAEIVRDFDRATARGDVVDA